MDNGARHRNNSTQHVSDPFHASLLNLVGIRNSHHQNTLSLAAVLNDGID